MKCRGVFKPILVFKQKTGIEQEIDFLLEKRYYYIT